MFFRSAEAQNDFDRKVAEAARSFIQTTDAEGFFEYLDTALAGDVTPARLSAARAALAEFRLAYHRLKFVEDFEHQYPVPTPPLQPVARVRHLKRGTTYDVFDASFQVSNPMLRDPDARKSRVVFDDDSVRVYRDDASGRFYVRFPDEFTPDRFEVLADLNV